MTLADARDPHRATTLLLTLHTLLPATAARDVCVCRDGMGASKSEGNRCKQGCREGRSHPQDGVENKAAALEMGVF